MQSGTYLNPKWIDDPRAGNFLNINAKTCGCVIAKYLGICVREVSNSGDLIASSGEKYTYAAID